jgi:sn1-specific diacylglycerol lipase
VVKHSAVPFFSFQKTKAALKMPSMTWFHRQWRVASDDFAFSSLLYAALLIGSGVMLATRVGNASDNYLADCPGSSVEWGQSTMGMLCVSLVTAVLFLVTSIFSFRGGVFELSKREAVPVLLYIVAACVCCLFILALLGAKYAIYDGETRHCPRASTRHVLRGAIVIDLLVFAAFAVSIAIAYDPSGARVVRNSSDYAHMWWKRFRICCCRCGKKSQSEDAYADLAQVFAAAFRGYDIVPSDIAAGMFLLHGYQERSRRLLASKVHYPPNPNGYKECISTQARLALRLTPQQVSMAHELQYYSRFYMAAYGWLLFTYQHCCTGVPRLCYFDPWMSCRDHPGRHVHQCCYCDVTALLHETMIPEEDVLYTNWSNRVCQPVHYAAFDRSSDSVVIAIRGSMSIQDCVTDFAATPEVISLEGTNGIYPTSEYYVHGGMLRSARYVHEILRQQGILQLILRGRYSTKKVVVLGHSLGAGVGLILSALLWSENPSLRGRLRCLAYSPPGGTVSRAVMEYESDFVVGTSLGYDMVPRLAQHTFDAFREAIFDVLAASSMNKNLIFLNVMRTQDIVKPFHPSTADTAARGRRSVESASYRESLRYSPCVPTRETLKLYSCTTTIHLMRAVRVSPCKSSLACCTWYTDEYFIPMVRGPEEVQMLMSSPTMFTDHFPDRYYRVMKKAIEQLDRGELDRFYVDSLPEPDPVVSDAAPMDFQSPWTHPEGLSVADYGAVV